MVELKTYVRQETREEKYIEISDSEYEFLLSLLKVSHQQELADCIRYMVGVEQALHVTINNIYIPPVVGKGRRESERIRV